MTNASAYHSCGCPRASGDILLAGPFTARYSRYLPRCTLGKHHHSEARIVLPLRGAFDTSHGRRMLTIDYGAALYRPMGDEHLDRYRVPIDCLALLLPAQDILRSARDPFVTRDTALTRVGSILREEMLTRDSASSLIVEGLALLVSSIVIHRRPLVEKGIPPWIGAIREQVEESLHEPPTLTDLALSVNRDPAYVAATFKRVYGNSVGTYFRHLRLWQARRCMDSNPACGLSDVAQRCGFADQSHFTRHFKRLFRTTPGEYRRRHNPVQAVARRQPE